MASQDHSSQLGYLRELLWSVRGKWRDLGINLKISSAVIMV